MSNPSSEVVSAAQLAAAAPGPAWPMHSSPRSRACRWRRPSAHLSATLGEGHTGCVDRATWRADRRAAVIATYDAEAAEYDQHEYPSETQRDWVTRLLRR